MTIRDTTTEENAVVLSQFFASQQKAKARSDQACKQLIEAMPILIGAMRIGSGQGERVTALVWSVWNGDHKVGLCDVLCGLDSDLAVAVVALIAARAHMAGNADDLIRKILTLSGAFEAQKAGSILAEA